MAARQSEQARRFADLEQQRAVRAAAVAVRHERLVGRIDRRGRPTASATTRAHHVRMAALHRRMQERHLTAALMHSSYADGLEGRDTADPSGPQSHFLMAVANSLGATGVGITLLDSSDTEAVRAASDATAAAAMDIEYTLGEGPGRDAATRRPVAAATVDELVARWPRYGPAVAELGIRSVASAALEHESRPLGAVTAFGAPPALRLDEVAGVLLQPEHNLGLPLLVESDVQAVVHQAAGMIAVQRGCGIDDALTLIRAHAFAANCSTERVASRIVDRRLRLD